MLGVMLLPRVRAGGPRLHRRHLQPADRRTYRRPGHLRLLRRHHPEERKDLSRPVPGCQGHAAKAARGSAKPGALGGAGGAEAAEAEAAEGTTADGVGRRLTLHKPPLNTSTIVPRLCCLSTTRSPFNKNSLQSIVVGTPQQEHQAVLRSQAAPVTGTTHHHGRHEPPPAARFRGSGPQTPRRAARLRLGRTAGQKPPHPPARPRSRGPRVSSRGSGGRRRRAASLPEPGVGRGRAAGGPALGEALRRAGQPHPRRCPGRPRRHQRVGAVRRLRLFSPG